MTAVRIIALLACLRWHGLSLWRVKCGFAGKMSSCFLCNRAGRGYRRTRSGIEREQSVRNDAPVGIWYSYKSFCPPAESTILETPVCASGQGEAVNPRNTPASTRVLRAAR